MIISFNEFRNDILVGNHLMWMNRFDSWTILTYVRRVYEDQSIAVIETEDKNSILMSFGPSANHEVCAVRTF